MTSLRNERALKISHTASDFGRSCGTALSEILKHSAVQFLFFIFIYIYIYTAFNHQQIKINEVFCFVLFCFFSITIVSYVKSVVFFSFSRSKSHNQMFLFSLSYHFFIFRRFIRYIANFFFNVKLHRIGTLHFFCLSIGANQKALSLKGIRVKATCLSNAEINQSLKRYKKNK